MAVTFKESTSVLVAAGKQFAADGCPRMAAAMAYYAIFSLPPLILLIIAMLGRFLGEQAVRGELRNQISGLVSPAAAEQIQTVIASASVDGKGLWATLFGIAIALFGASAAFAQLQVALNTAWGVKPDPNRGGVRSFLLKRLISFGMVLVVGLLLLVSLIVSAVLTLLSRQVGGWMPSELWSITAQLLNALVSFAVITLLFGAIFKVMPDVDLAWSDVWRGALFTSLLFLVGRYGVSIYLGYSDVGSAYGAAGSLVLVLFWVYYSALVLFLGAEYTQVWSRRFGSGFRPSRGAVAVRPEPEAK